MAKQDSPVARLELAAEIFAAFRALGYQPIQYGGATVEVYSDGQYCTGDLDIGFLYQAPPIEERSRVMQALGSPPGVRLFQYKDAVVDLGGVAEMFSRNFVEIKTAKGAVLLEAPEEAIIQRLLLAYYPQSQPDQLKAAELLIRNALAGNFAIDWAEVRRLAGLPMFNVLAQFEALYQRIIED
ncbi:MAG: hypothetical protein LBK71_10325 [Verrucomicrobiales bacterium]|jgi:hypothetical protein|nr:hypothetical protein [Verrucomicrobiales bacterium]